MAGTYTIYPPAPSSLVGAAPSINSTTSTGNIVVFQNNGIQEAAVDMNGAYLESWQAARGSAYGKDDFWGVNQGTYTAAGSGFTLTGNGVGVGLTNPGKHPGFYYYTASAVATSSIQNRSTFVISKAEGRTITWNGMFQALTLSTATNRYIGYVGMFDNATTPFNGPYFKYSDNVNSGNWVLAYAESNVEVATSNTSTTVDTGWHTLTIVLTEANATYTYYIDNVNVGSLVATALNAGTNYDISAFSVNLNRTVSSGATVNAWVLDLYTIGMAGMTR